MASNYDEILQKLCDHLKQFCPPEVEITPETDLINQLAIDSVKFLNLVWKLRMSLIFPYR